MVKTAQDIILKTVRTEASMEDLRAGKYTFKVAITANKIEIKDAVEAEIQDACKFAEESPYPDASEAYTDLFVD